MDPSDSGNREQINENIEDSLATLRMNFREMLK